MSTCTFPVEIDWPEAPRNRQIVFHGINKSGSLAMANVLKCSFEVCEARRDFISHYHLHGDLKDYIDRMESTQGNGFFVAHYLYGAVKKASDRTFVTQFRHPVPRLLSCYQWVKKKYEARTGGSADFPSLETFIKKGKGKRHSQIIQLGAGYGPDAKLLLGLSNNELLERSLIALEKDVGAVAIAEYFEESIFFFAALCDLPYVTPWVRDQRNPGRILSHEADPNVVAMIRDHYRWDFVLYEQALKRFRKQIKGATFGQSLDDYKAACSGEYNDRILGPKAERFVGRVRPERFQRDIDDSNPPSSGEADVLAQSDPQRPS
ncbi:MAG: hypothetical protein KIS73_13710 [Enhydrobacter sp.]|nr:hypothetical protein [Enhydrobacter sp.]